MSRSPIGPIACAVAGALILSGCALKSDLNITIDELVALKRSQQQMQLSQQEMRRELQLKDQVIEEGRHELSASQTEFRSGSESISQEMARLALQLSEFQIQMANVSRHIKELKNFQTIGLGSLSKRIDDGTDRTQGQINTQSGRIDTQSKRLERFATEVAGQIDGANESLTKLNKGLATLRQSNKNRIVEIKRLHTQLDELVTKLTGELKKQGSRIDSGGSGGDTAALKQQMAVLGKKLPAAVDAQGKRIGAVQQELRDLQSLLSDLNSRLKALEGR